GTLVSGILGALTNNGVGMAGVGPNVRVLPVRVLGKCGGFDSDIIAGMRWAAGLAVPDAPPNPTPARVINMSLGGPGACHSAYTDSFKFSLGTSFAAPLVSGTAALMLSVRPALTPQQVRQILQATTRGFPTTGGDNGDGTPVPACNVPQYNGLGTPIDQLQCYCTTYTCGVGMLDAGAALSAV